MANQLEQLSNQSSPEALRILALGGSNPAGSQGARSAAFLNALGGIQGFAPTGGKFFQPGEFGTAQERLGQQFSQAQDALEAQLEARGVASSGIADRAILDLLQGRADAFAQLEQRRPPRPGSIGGGGSADFQDSLPDFFRPAGPRPSRRGGAGPSPGDLGLTEGVTADLGLQAPQFKGGGDEAGLRSTLEEEQRKFALLTGTGAITPEQRFPGMFTSTNTAAQDALQRALSERRTEFGTLDDTRKIQRRLGESLDDFLQRQAEFQDDPRNMTPGELAGLTLRGMATIRQANEAMPAAMKEIQEGFTQESFQDRIFLNNVSSNLNTLSQGNPAMIQAVLRSRAANLLGNFKDQDLTETPDGLRLLSDLAQSEAGQRAIADQRRQLEQQVRLGARRFEQKREAAMADARNRQVALASKVFEAQSRVKSFAKVLDEKRALKSGAVSNAGKRRSSGALARYDKDLYSRLAMRVNRDPNEIVASSGLPFWQHARLFADQRDVIRALSNDQASIEELLGLEASPEQQQQMALQAQPSRRSRSNR